MLQTVMRRILGHIGLYECVAFITGFVLMAFELAASRVLAPTIGTSTYVWTSVIGVMIAALAGGYAAGGWVADRRSRKIDVAWLLLAAALAIVVTCIFYTAALASITLFIGDPRLQGVIASCILFVPASFLLGMASPYLAKLRVRSVATTGRSVAGLSASNSVGGIIGTFCTGFIFFAIIGSRETLVLLAVLLVAASWLIEPGIRRKQRFLLSIAMGGVLLLQFFAPVSADVVADIDTPSAHYKITTIQYHNRAVHALVMGPGGWQSGSYVDGSKELVFEYSRKLADVIAAAPAHNRILLLGGGAFNLPEYVGRHYPDAQIDVVEIDPKLPGIAKRYFNFEQPPNVHIYTEDARRYLQQTTAKYDIIVSDVYNDSTIPFALTTHEYTADLKAALQPKGVVAANIIAAANPACSPLLASLHDSYTHAFDHALYYPLFEMTMQVPQNIIAVYSNAPLDWANGIPGSVFVQLGKAHQLTDNFAPIEYLKQRCDG